MPIPTINTVSYIVLFVIVSLPSERRPGNWKERKCGEQWTRKKQGRTAIKREKGVQWGKERGRAHNASFREDESGGVCGVFQGNKGWQSTPFFDVRREEVIHCTIQDSCICAAELCHRRQETAHRRVCVQGEGEVVSRFKEDLWGTGAFNSRKNRERVSWTQARAGMVLSITQAHAEHSFKCAHTSQTGRKER